MAPLIEPPPLSEKVSRKSTGPPRFRFSPSVILHRAPLRKTISCFPFLLSCLTFFFFCSFVGEDSIRNEDGFVFFFFFMYRRIREARTRRRDSRNLCSG